MNFLLGIDLGSSSVKVALVEQASGKCVDLVHMPSEEMDITSMQKGWAEQDPNVWWVHICDAITTIKKRNHLVMNTIKSIGISYQMHGLVLVDKHGDVLRDSIIWCDSRAVSIGEKAFDTLGPELCLSKLYNSPGNFTASKLRWVKENEPDIYKKIHKVMLPGDFIAYKLSGEINTTIPGLSEGIMWDFKENCFAGFLFDYFELDESLVPPVVNTFSIQSVVDKNGEQASGILAGTPITYRAGDQPNNALSLNVFNHGEVAMTGGTSGVVYAVSTNNSQKATEHVNNFAHVNYDGSNSKSIGKLLCINGAGIQYKWLKNTLKLDSYTTMNSLAEEVSVGSEGLRVFPFGNGAERMFENKLLGTSISDVDLNRHTNAHLCRATLEGIAFSMVYAVELLYQEGVAPTVLRAGNDNLFQSKIFSETIATLLNKEIEIYNTTGAIGAARASDLHSGNFDEFSQKIFNNDYAFSYHPNSNHKFYDEAYASWKSYLKILINR
ncbi:MAG: xylulokinase [Jejuia sp.]